MRKDLRCKFTQQLRLVPLRQFLKHRIYTLAPRIPHSTQPITRHRPSNRPREIRHNKSHRPATQATDHTPEFPCGTRLLAFRHALLSQHLFEDATKLLVAEFGLFLVVGAFEAEGTPWEVRAEATTGFGWGAWYLFFIWVSGVVVIIAAEGVVVSMVLAGGVVVAAARWVGESVVGVVDLLEFLGAGSALGGVGGDTVGMGFEGLLFVGVADLLLGCFGGDIEDHICLQRGE